MTSKFDRLERFFTSRRKTSPSVESVSPSAQAVEPQFPSPSFIRPKTSRMTARDEVGFRQANERSPSVPDIRSQRLGSSYSRNQTLPTPDSMRQFPPRSPSFNGQCLEPLLMELNEFQFPTPPSRSGDLTPMSMTFGSSTSDITQPPSPRSRSPKSTGITPRLDSPPPSHLRDPRYLPRIKIPTNTLPTPRESPQLGPVPGSPLTDLNLKPTSFDDFQDQLDDAFGQFYPDRFCGDSGLGSPSSYRLTYCSFTLREPDFNDFLNLSDDDIAESALDSPTFLSRNDLESLPPIIDLSVPPPQPSDPSLLTLSPPRASRPAESGALMAARIAKRFDFDLIYIVNLWPSNSAYQLIDPEYEVPENPLKGRLLAAHGLQNVPSPLQISSQVHKTILGSDGWIEYRNTAARPDELACGYARAFYTGTYTRTSSGSNSDHDMRSSNKVDRGIVFAAYRKPRAGDASGQGFGEEQLSDLHDEAETLVNVLLDIHAQSRGRQPPTTRRLSDETGPMPFF